MISPANAHCVIDIAIACREEFLKKIDLLEKKLPWLRYQGLRNEARKVKEELTEAQQQLESLQQQQQPLQQKIVCVIECRSLSLPL